MNKKVLISVVSFLGVGAIIVLSALLINQQNEIKNLKNGSAKMSSSGEVKKETKAEEIKGGEVAPVASKNTFESKHTNLKFEYPEGWTISEKQQGNRASGDVYVYTTTLTNKNGKKIVLTEGLNSGLGGGCLDESLKVSVGKLADSKISGYPVVAMLNGRNEIFVSHSTKVGNLSECEAGWFPTLTADRNSPIKFNNGDPLHAMFQFEGAVSDITPEENKEIVEILSSLSLK